MVTESQFSIELEPAISRIGVELSGAIEEVTEQVFIDIAEILPEELRTELSGASPAPTGSAPGKRSGYLFNSVKGKVVDGKTAQIEMAEYAQYHDEFFGGKGHPFVLEPIARTLDQIR